MKMPTLLAGLCLTLLLNVTDAQALRFQDRTLTLKGSAQACYMAFLKLYDAAYYRSEDGAAQCVRLDYLRSFDADQIARATERVLVDRYGQRFVDSSRSQLARVIAGYRAVDAGDSYQYCVTMNSGGELLRDGKVVAQLDDKTFADRFLGIWVVREDAGGFDWNFPTCRSL